MAVKPTATRLPTKATPPNNAGAKKMVASFKPKGGAAPLKGVPKLKK